MRKDDEVTEKHKTERVGFERNKKCFVFACIMKKQHCFTFKCV